ncbi:MAG: PD40 domain-containing protein [Bacteroidales bacterium]|nr:PD40 domain-containing protein [Candidatus Cacconaster caballi]
MKKNLFLCALLLAAGCIAAEADEGRLLRFPSTNGTDVVFSYAGDLYKAPLTGGEAVRLTSHIGYEMFAKFSPDGKTIAFTGQYDGNTEVYSIPAQGGEPVRLTYTSTNARDDIGDRMGPNNIVMGWHPDGKSIIYRNRIGSGFEGKLWTIGADGGMSSQVPLPEGGFCCYSPDGKKLAYNRTFREFRTWKYYKGGQADDIWIYDGKRVTNITGNPAQDIMPMWIGDEIFFISDRDHWMNIFVYDTKSGKTEKVTDFKEYDVKFPSTNGKLIVYENGGYIYRLDPSTRESRRINITLNAEGIYARSEKVNVSSNITSRSISSKGDRIAVTSRGEVFTVPVTAGVTRNITHTPGANERGASFSPDGKYIAFISDRTGETEVYLQDVEKNSPVQLTKDNDTYIRSLIWSPDSKTVLYTDRKNRLVSISVPDGSKKVIMTNPASEIYGISFSADSKWIAYTKPAANEMSVVYVRELSSDREIQVTEKWYSASIPIFSKDGKYLIFNAERDFNPTYSQIEWNYAYSNMGSLYLALLSEDTPSPLLPKDGREEEKAAAGKKDDAGKKADTVMKIDAEGISERIVKLPVGSGFFRPDYCDGTLLWYSGRGGLSTIDLSTGEKTEIGNVRMTVVGDKALISEKGVTYVGAIPKGKTKPGKGIDFSNMTAIVDYGQEWAQIFDETWRAFRDGYYLENMHGIDWPAMKRKYEVFLPYVKCRIDLNYVIGEMIGELTSGHAYVSPGKYPQAKRVNMGLLGASISRDRSGFYRIDHILKGANYSESLRGPLAEPGLGVKEGDFIIAVDGVLTNTTDNIYTLLEGKANVLTELLISGKASESGARKIIVKPTADEDPLYHYEWVVGNIEKVEKASNGRIGYIYIPDMGPEGLNEFARYYYPQLDKEALIIDDRANGGGNVSPMILERLLRQPYNMTMRRGSNMVSKVPEGTFYGPKVCLINKYSASDGDLFPWRFKALGIGELIGTRTWGGIVGISGSLPYMDGTDIRVPFFTNYDAKSGEWIVENHGVDPDIEIDNDPIKEYAGIDQQLEKAVEVLLEKLKERKPLPGVPAPRDFSWKEQ